MVNSSHADSFQTTEYSGTLVGMTVNSAHVQYVTSWSCAGKAELTVIHSQPEHVSGAENGAERVKNSWSGSGAVSGLLKKSRSVSGAWSGMNYPLKFRSNHLNFGLHKSQ